MKAMRCLSCIRIAPTPVNEASVSIIKSLLKSGRAKTRALIINYFN